MAFLEKEINVITANIYNQDYRKLHSELSIKIVFVSEIFLRTGHEVLKFVTTIIFP